MDSSDELYFINDGNFYLNALDKELRLAEPVIGKNGNITFVAVEKNE